MGDDPDYKRNGGVNISGYVGVVHGDIVGRDKAISLNAASLEYAFAPLTDFLNTVPASQREEAKAKLVLLKEEAGKGDRSTDTVIARLVEGLVGVIPGAASSVVSAFASPILGAVAGPVTAYVIDRLRSQ